MKDFRNFIYGSRLEQFGFFVRASGHFLIRRPELTKHAHFGEIFWCRRGCGFFEDASRKKFLLRPGWMWYYPPGSFHNFRPGNPCFDYYWLSIEGRDAAVLFNALKIRPGLNHAGPCPEEDFASLFLSLNESTLQARMHSLAIAFRILTQTVSPEHAAVPVLEQIRKLIMENYGDNTLNVAKMAEMFNMHRVTLSRSFSAAYGIGPKEYLDSVRLRAGIKMLTTTSQSVKEVAFRCGFSSSGYFAKAVRKLSGHTPGQLRNQPA